MFVNYLYCTRAIFLGSFSSLAISLFQIYGGLSSLKVFDRLVVLDYSIIWVDLTSKPTEACKRLIICLDQIM